MSEIISVSVSDIQENPSALRSVNRENETYLGIVDSMRQKGFFGALTGRRKTDADGVEFFELLDGLHRYSAAKDAGLTQVNMDVLSVGDAEALELQIMANTHRVETRHVEYAKQLLRILTMNPLLTEAELAERLGKSSQWISQRLGLKVFDGKIAELINEGKIGLSNAYALARLPEDEWENFADRAMTESPAEFIPACQDRAKEIREAKRKGKEAQPLEFKPKAFCQKLSDIKGELDSGEVCKVVTVNATTPQEGWALAIQWILHLDPNSVEAQRAKYEEKEAAKAKARADRKAKRDAEKAAKEKIAETEAAEAAVSL